MAWAQQQPPCPRGVTQGSKTSPSTGHDHEITLFCIGMQLALISLLQTVLWQLHAGWPLKARFIYPQFIQE